MKFSAIVVAAALAFGLSSIAAQAQAHRTFVSGPGSDSNPCTRIQPCQTFER
jgi:hypothetical protein